LETSTSSLKEILREPWLHEDLRESRPELFLEPEGSLMMEAFRRLPEEAAAAASSSPCTGVQLNRESDRLVAVDRRGLAAAVAAVWSRTREPFRGLKESYPNGLRMKVSESRWLAEELMELLGDLWECFSLTTEDLRDVSESWTECFLATASSPARRAVSKPAELVLERGGLRLGGSLLLKLRRARRA
jgi:hypothetical protein